MNAEYASKFAKSRIEVPASPMTTIASVTYKIGTAVLYVIEKLTARPTHSSQRACERSAVISLSQFRCEKPSNINDRLYAMFRDFQARRIVQNPAIFKLSKYSPRLGDIGLRRIPLCTKRSEIQPSETIKNLFKPAPIPPLRLGVFSTTSQSKQLLRIIIRNLFVLPRRDAALAFQIPQGFDLGRLIVVAVLGADDEVFLEYLMT